jgi:hypothetical protein
MNAITLNISNSTACQLGCIFIVVTKLYVSLDDDFDAFKKCLLQQVKNTEVKPTSNLQGIRHMEGNVG